MAYILDYVVINISVCVAMHVYCSIFPCGVARSTGFPTDIFNYITYRINIIRAGSWSRDNTNTITCIFNTIVKHPEPVRLFLCTHAFRRWPWSINYIVDMVLRKYNICTMFDPHTWLSDIIELIETSIDIIWRTIRASVVNLKAWSGRCMSNVVQ